MSFVSIGFIMLLLNHLKSYDEEVSSTPMTDYLVSLTVQIVVSSAEHPMFSFTKM